MKVTRSPDPLNQNRDSCHSTASLNYKVLRRYELGKVVATCSSSRLSQFASVLGHCNGVKGKVEHGAGWTDELVAWIIAVG